MIGGAKTHVILRPYKASEDQGFLYSTWIQGMYFGNDWKGPSAQSEGTFRRRFSEVIKSIITKPTVTIMVAALKQDPDVILGYSVTEPDILHWVYVKPTWRKFGIAKALVPDDVKIVTHQTNRGRSLMPKAWAYDPFMI